MDSRHTTTRKRRSFAFLLSACASLLACCPNPHSVLAFSTTSPSIKTPFLSSSTESAPSSTLLTFPVDHNFKPKASGRMRTLVFSTDKNTESSMGYSELDRNGHSGPAAVNGKEQERVVVNNGKSYNNANGKQPNLSVLDKVSGMFKMSKPNLSLAIPSFPFYPRPPKKAPIVDAQLQVDLMTSERSIQLLQAEVNLLREKLDFQLDDHLQLQNSIRDANRARKLEHEQRISEQLHKVGQQRQALEKTKRQLDLAQQNMVALETEYKDRLATQSKEFAHQRTHLERQLADLSAKLGAITADFSRVNQTLSGQSKEFLQVQQDAKTQKESLRQQIVKLEASLKEANNANVELKDSLSSSNASLQTLQKEWQDLVSKENQRRVGEQKAQDQVALLETQNNETKMALQMAEKRLEKTIVEKEELELENHKAWSLERNDLESRVKSLQSQLAGEKMNKENILSEWKLAQAEQEVKHKDQQRLLEANHQASVYHLKAELEETKAQYETDLESMAVKKINDVLSLKESMKAEQALQEQELQDENAKLKEELAKMKQLYEQKEEERQAETKALQTQLDQQQETSKTEASQREQALQTQIETATAEQASKMKSLEAEVNKLRQENESLNSSLVQATKSRDESIEKAMVLQKEYTDLRADQDKWEEQVSLLKREFQQVQDAKKELETQLVTVTLEKEEYLLKAQTLEANVQTLSQKNAQLQQQRNVQQQQQQQQGMQTPQQNMQAPHQGNMQQQNVQQQQGMQTPQQGTRRLRRDARDFGWATGGSYPPDRMI